MYVCMCVCAYMEDKYLFELYVPVTVKEVCVCVYVCIYVWIYVYVYMYVCMYVRVNVSTYVCIYRE